MRWVVVFFFVLLIGCATPETVFYDNDFSDYIDEDFPEEERANLVGEAFSGGEISVACQKLEHELAFSSEGRVKSVPRFYCEGDSVHERECGQQGFVSRMVEECKGGCYGGECGQAAQVVREIDGLVISEYEARKNVPEVVYAGPGDTFEVNGWNLEIVASYMNDDGSAGSQLVMYRENQGERIYFPSDYWYLTTRKLYYRPRPFVSTNDVSVYLVGHDPEKKKGIFEVYDDCVGLYEKCIADGVFGEKICEESACRYEPYKKGVKKMSQGRFAITYKDDYEALAHDLMVIMPGCFEMIERKFGVEQNFDQFTLRLKPYQRGDPRAWAGPDWTTLKIRQLHLDRLVSPVEGFPCEAGIFPMGHEFVHVHDYGSWTKGLLREGFANFLDSKVSEQSYTLDCQEEGYIRTWINGYKEDFVEYPSTRNELKRNLYMTGQCYFQRLEERFGVETMNEFVLELGSRRNVPAEDVNYFDLINLFFGSEAVRMAKSLGIETDCTVDIPGDAISCPE